jgi:ABC-type transport system substrate-binding protein
MQPLGIKINMKGLDTATSFENLLKTYKYDVHIGYMGGSAPNGIGGGAGLSAMYSKNIIPGSFEVNFVRYNNPEYDALYEQLLKVTDTKKRIDIAWKLQEMYMEGASLILICVNPKTYAIRDFVGFPADTSGFMIRGVSWTKGTKRTGK